MSAKRGEMNGWRCQACKAITMTIHVHDGVTPMFLACRASGKDPGTPGECQGTGISLGYPEGDPPGAAIATLLVRGWEWYRPDAAELARADTATCNHVARGGLLIRRLSPEGALLVPDLLDAAGAVQVKDDVLHVNAVAVCGALGMEPTDANQQTVIAAVRAVWQDTPLEVDDVGRRN